MSATDLTPQQDALRRYMEGLMPDWTCEIDRATWMPLTFPEPCERCGTMVVLLEWDQRSDRRRWCEVTLAACRRRMAATGNKRSGLDLHGPRRCGAARLTLAEPRQMTLDDLIEAEVRRQGRAA